MNTTVVEMGTVNAEVVNAEHLTVHVIKDDRIPAPELDWYPRQYFRDHYIPDSLLDQWVAAGYVRAKKAAPTQQATRFFRLADVRERLESLADVPPREARAKDFNFPERG